MKEYKYFNTLTILYVVIGISSLPLGYKLVQLGPFLVSGGAFFVPFRFMLGDILAEVYGYKAAKKQIFNLIFSGFVFSTFAYFIIRLPSPAYWHHQSAFNFVLGKTLYITTIAAVGILIGSNLNMYLVSKLRIVFKNRFFIARSLFASITGELTQYIIITSLLYIGILPVAKILHLAVNDYLIQLIFIFIVATPAAVTAKILRKKEAVDLSQEVVNFNPFAGFLKK